MKKLLILLLVLAGFGSHAQTIKSTPVMYDSAGVFKYKVMNPATGQIVGTKVLPTEASVAAATNPANMSYTAPYVGSPQVSVADALAVQSQGGLGDFTVDGALLIFCGDSTTEQQKAAGAGMDRLNQLRAAGEPLEKVAGVINFGGSGYTLNGFVNDPVSTLPTISTANSGDPSTWDYYGHKPTGATSLATALAWRAGKADRALWNICFGINDVILNASVGNLTQAQITDYIAQRLRTAIGRIQKAYPKDKIVLRVPNPMTARPYVSAAGYPSQAQYPAFGSDLTTDAALVEKWNQALRNAYLTVQNESTGTVLFDTWKAIYGPSSTTLTVSQLPTMYDLVHPGTTGYVQQANELVNLIAPTPALSSAARKVEAEGRVTASGGNVWDYYPNYFRGDDRYKKVWSGKLSGAGSNYIDLGIPFTVFQRLIGSQPLYVSIGSRAAQYFATYAPNATGSNTRLTGVVPSALMQASTSGATMELYTDAGLTLIANDVYVDGQAKKAKDAFAGKIGSAGVGYFDFQFSETNNRLSPKYLSGLKGGSVAVGGTASVVLSTTSASVSRNGTNAQRVVRFSGLGSTDYAAYAQQPAALYFNDSQPSPKVYEAVFPVKGAIPHAQNGRGLVVCPMRMEDGATISAFLTETIASIITVEVYSLTYPNRVLVGTISIPANTGSATLSTGNPTLIQAGQLYEYVITSATSQTTGLVGITITPN